MKVIRLTGDDATRFDEMLTVFARAFDEEDTYVAARPGPNHRARLFDSNTFVALVAVQDDTVVGALAAYELIKFEQERSEFYIYDLAVDVAFRRQGIATALIGELRRIAAERGAWVIFVQADHGDDAAIALYTKLGLREDVLHFDIPVDAGSQ